jgi:hypothetical protein
MQQNNEVRNEFIYYRYYRDGWKDGAVKCRVHTHALAALILQWNAASKLSYFL